MISRLISFLFFLTPFAYSSSPESVEDFLYTTVRIECRTGQGDSKVGTGFIYDFKEKNGSTSPYLVTNYHVIEDAAFGNIKFNISQDNKRPNDQYLVKGIKGYNGTFSQLFILHSSIFLALQSSGKVNLPSPGIVDLCAFPLAHLISQIENNLNKEAFNQYNQAMAQYQKDYQVAYSQTQLGERGAPFLPYPSQPTARKVFYRSLNKSHLIDLSYESPIQDILMVGYPIGISDEVNNLPIFRKGVTASHINKDFQGRREVLIDAACFPGSSGSPIFLSEGIKGTYYAGAHFKPRLLGILWGGPMHKINGQLEYQSGTNIVLPTPIPTDVSSYIPSHLGFVIKGDALMDIQKRILQ